MPPGQSPQWIAIVGLCSLLILGVVVMVVRRRRGACAHDFVEGGSEGQHSLYKCRLCHRVKYEKPAKPPLPLLTLKVPKVEGEPVGPIGVSCGCFKQWESGEEISRRELELHAEVQDTQCEGWRWFNELIEKAARDGTKTFEPLSVMGVEKYRQVIELPPTIAKLKAVKVLSLYGRNLVRVPPEIGEMASLEEFDPYTSYRLHWFPYELLRCKNLRRSRVSTRALSVCGQPIAAGALQQVWISLRVATDVFPLLVCACSQACIGRLPPPAEGYVGRPHAGGLDLAQSEADG
jgi:hypothetical protein